MATNLQVGFTMRFDQPVSAFMSLDPVTITTDDLLSRAAQLLQVRRVSALPVVTRAGTFAGVITRTELLHAGRVTPGKHPGELDLVLPDLPVAAYLSHPDQICAPTTSLRDAAEQMVAARVHRLVVIDGRRIVGVVGTHHLVGAVRDARLDLPLREVTRAPVAALPAHARVREAAIALERSLDGVVLVHEDWPVGVFTTLDALATRWLSRELPAIDFCDRAVAVMPADLPLFHAAAIASELDVTRVVAMRDGKPCGLASGLDIARVVAS